MPDSGKPATGPLIMEQVVQIVSTMEDLRKLFEVHTGAAAQHRAIVLKELDEIHKDLHYYGGQLIKSYHSINTSLRRLTEQLDRERLAEEERLA